MELYEDSVIMDGSPKALPVEQMARIASGDFSTETREFLQTGFRRFLESGGTLPLERCLRLPTTPKKIRKAQRDFWLRRAWGLMEGSPWMRSVRLADEIRRFESLGIWWRWRDLDRPPPEASELRAALWQAFHAGLAVPVTPTGVDKVIRGGIT